MTITPLDDPAFDPIRAALIARMQALGYQDTSAERVDKMMKGWDWFTDNSIDDRGRPTYLGWMDLEIVELLFDALYLRYGIKRAAEKRTADRQRNAKYQAELQAEEETK